MKSYNHDKNRFPSNNKLDLNIFNLNLMNKIKNHKIIYNYY